MSWGPTLVQQDPTFPEPFSMSGADMIDAIEAYWYGEAPDVSLPEYHALFPTRHPIDDEDALPYAFDLLYHALEGVAPISFVRCRCEYYCTAAEWARALLTDRCPCCERRLTGPPRARLCLYCDATPRGRA